MILQYIWAGKHTHTHTHIYIYIYLALKPFWIGKILCLMDKNVEYFYDIFNSKLKCKIKIPRLWISPGRFSADFHAVRNIYLYKYIYICVCVCVCVCVYSRVCSLFNSYNTEVLGRALPLFSGLLHFILDSYLTCWVLSKEVSSIIFCVFGMTRLGIESRSSRSLTNTLTIMTIYTHLNTNRSVYTSVCGYIYIYIYIINTYTHTHTHTHI